MPVSQRAKIFAPFDALQGLHAALREKERLADPRRILSEDRLEELDRAASVLKKGSRVTIEYYQDGAYRTVSGQIAGIDPENRLFKISDMDISFGDIYDIREQEGPRPLSYS